MERDRWQASGKRERDRKKKGEDKGKRWMGKFN
jgi:hypothetical protein